MPITRLMAGALLASVAAAPAMAADVIVPSTTGNAQGPAPLRYYGTGGSRVQQIYASSFFSGTQSINSISFRAYPGAAPSGFFSNSVSVSDVTIRLATTALSANESSGLQPGTNFDANLGTAFATAFTGPLTLTTAATGTGTQPFDYTITFATPFVYDASLGNLLLDVFIPTTATVSGGGFGFLTFDSVNTNDDGLRSIVNIFDGGAANGVLDTAGAITSFGLSAAAVPEPATWGMMILGIGLIGATARRRAPRQLLS